MSMHTANLYTPDGRLRGSYVYMLLCQIDRPIHIKVGRSSTPFSRLDDLRISCPVVPQVMAVAEVFSIRKAVRLESDLHLALDNWHSHLEWFVVLPEERAAFNAAWKPVIAAHSTPSRRIEWISHSVPALIRAAETRKRLQKVRFARRGKAFHDYVSHGGQTR